MSKTALTHAGTVVFRETAAGPEVLVISPKDQAQQWVLPKGHIDPGEEAEETARRELFEETGIDAEIIESLGVEDFAANYETVRVEFFLARQLDESPAEEKRRKAWLRVDEALQRVSFTESRSVLARARKVLTRGELSGRGPN